MNGVEVVLQSKFCNSISISLFDQVVFYKMAAYCRPEVAGDVIFGQRAFGVEFVPLTKFGDPSSNCLATIQNATDGQTDKVVRRAYLMHCALHVLHQWANENDKFSYYRPPQSLPTSVVAP